MTDIRDQVANDRGAIKKIQLLFPGYHGYRVNEDLRDADIYLKDELYKKMLNIINILKNGESNLVSNGVFKNLEVLGRLRSNIQTAAADVKHHEAGYSGISAPIKINAEKISALYDMDMKIYQEIIALSDSAQKFSNNSITGNMDADSISQMSISIGNIMQINSSREKLLYGGV